MQAYGVVYSPFGFKKLIKLGLTPLETARARDASASNRVDKLFYGSIILDRTYVRKGVAYVHLS